MKTKVRNKELWTMPDWMEKYRDKIGNTGGNKIEDFMNCDSVNCNISVNAVRALLCLSVTSQVSLLTLLHREGVLP